MQQCPYSMQSLGDCALYYTQLLQSMFNIVHYHLLLGCSQIKSMCGSLSCFTSSVNSTILQLDIMLFGSSYVLGHMKNIGWYETHTIGSAVDAYCIMVAAGVTAEKQGCLIK